MTIGRPLLLWLLLLAPLSALAIAWLWRRRLARERLWASVGMWRALGRVHRPVVRGLLTLLLALCVGATALALARPRWGGERETLERRGIDLVFVLDTSMSMAARDVKPSRVLVATTLVRRIAQAMPGSRIALVQAEGRGVVLTPLTLDAAVLDLLLATTAPGTAPTPGTRLRPALSQALELFSPSSRGHGAIVLLSDGEDHGGGLEDVAASIRAAGISVFALGVGTLEGGPIPARSGDAFKRTESGEVVITHLEEANLEMLARSTGGVYLRASSPITDLSPVLEELREIRTRHLTDRVNISSAERFQWPLGLAALLLVVALALRVDVAPEDTA